MDATSASTTGRGRWRGMRAALAMVAAAGALGCSEAGADLKVPVFPVTGKVTFEGEPAAGAFVVFHPRTPPREGDTPSSPRATVQPDGSFALTTSTEGDGAPAGDYAVTVQWMKPVKQGKDLVPGPNVVPKAYAEASSTPLTASIRESDNALEPFAITRK
ncbi:hypothetical protein [Paludisphaera sp.]|uniref:hypothetical protein n=1 Tax=Paludisphaera sp. TaxID=2017432 RepID=UPI00301B9C20